MRFLKKLLIAVYAYLAIFALICLGLWVFKGSEPQTLIVGVFGAAGLESIIAGIMKLHETQAEKKEKNNGGEQK